jgi:hypothetical protein
MISVNCGADHEVADGWEAAPLYAVMEMAEAVREPLMRWSPLLWRYGRRKSQNCLYAGALGFDFDDGEKLKIAEASDAFAGFSAIIYTTRNHGKQKVTRTGQVKAATERYRLVLMVSRFLTLPEWRLIQWLAHHSLGSEDCGDLVQDFRGSENAVISILGGPKCVDVDAWVGLARRHLPPSPVARRRRNRDNPGERRVVEALALIDPDLHHDDWKKVGMALHQWDQQRGLDLWREWSANGTKFRSGECESCWRTFVPREGGITIATLFALSKEVHP